MKQSQLHMPLQEVFLDTQVLFDRVLIKAQIEQHVNVKILANNNQCYIGRIIKSNQLIKIYTSEDIIIVINESAFVKLTSEQKEIVVEELVSSIYFDSNKSYISIANLDIYYYSEFIKRVGYDKFQKLADNLAVYLN